MRRHITLLAALALAVSMGCAKGAPHKLGAAGPPPGRIIPVGYDPSVSGLSGAVGEVVYVSGGTAAWVRNGTANTAWVAFPVSGGTTYTAGTGIGIDGGTIANTAPSSSDEVFQKLNSVSAPFTILERKADWVSNTAGSETAYYNAIVPIAGAQVTLPISSANIAGQLTSTTSGATPSVAFGARYDSVKITIGDLVTKLLITGLNLNTDDGYDFDGVCATSAAEVHAKLNDADDTGLVMGSYTTGTTSLYNPNALILSDQSHNFYFRAALRNVAAGSRKFWTASMVASDVTLVEGYTGSSTLVSNVTSISVNALPAGSVVTIRRIRQSAN